MKSLIRVLLLFSMLSASISANEIVKLPDYGMKLSIVTKASKAAIWQLWEDVDNWKDFDERLEYSYLIDGARFEKGAIGYIKGQGAPKTRFELTQVNNGVAFTEVLYLPLWQTIELKRYFEESEAGHTVFTHEVNFKGALKPLFYCFLARSFAKDLKKVMTTMKTLAQMREQENSQ